ncbi:LmeA family phospholipid-binding protein [Nocardiopsis coralliicola]
MRKLVVFLVLLVILVVVADRGLHYAAQTEIAKRVGQQYEMASEPEVTVGGFPFLTQAFQGTYSEINIVTGAMNVNDVQLERVDVTAYDVDAPLQALLTEPTATARTAEATVMLPYSELQKRLPEGIVIENEDGQPRMAGDLALHGFSQPVSAGLEVAVEGDAIVVTPTDVAIGGTGTGVDLTAQVNDRLAVSFPIPSLPFNLQVTGIDARPNGVQVSAEAEDVPLIGAEQQG